MKKIIPTEATLFVLSAIIVFFASASQGHPEGFTAYMLGAFVGTLLFAHKNRHRLG